MTRRTEDGSGWFLRQQIGLMEAWLADLSTDAAARRAMMRYFVIYLRRYVIRQHVSAASDPTLKALVDELSEIAHGSSDAARFRFIAAQVLVKLGVDGVDGVDELDEHEVSPRASLQLFGAAFRPASGSAPLIH